MKKHLKRFLSMMMAVLLCFGIVPSNAFAAEYDYDGYISMIDYNGRGYSLSSSLPAPFGGYSTDKFTELRINDLTAFRTAYCIQLGVATHTGIGYDQSDDYAALTTEQKAMINTALTLGYNVETGTKYGGSAMDEYIATQILIWLIAHGQLGTGYENQIVNEITANSPAAKTIFQKLRENVVTYHTVPSFATDNPSAVGAYIIWKCPSCNTETRYLPDRELMSSVLSAINRAIEDPQKVMNFKKNANCLSVQAVRLENEIYRELGNPKSNSKRLLEIIKQCAQEKYKACHANGDSEETECLIAELKKLQPMEHFQSQILRKFICKILITPAGAVTIQLKNGAII